MWIKLGVFNTAIYGKIVRCSFKSFEQCTLGESFTEFTLPITLERGLPAKHLLGPI